MPSRLQYCLSSHLYNHVIHAASSLGISCKGSQLGLSSALCSMKAVVCSVTELHGTRNARNVSLFETTVNTPIGSCLRQGSRTLRAVLLATQLAEVYACAVVARWSQELSALFGCYTFDGLCKDRDPDPTQPACFARSVSPSSQRPLCKYCRSKPWCA